MKTLKKGDKVIITAIHPQDAYFLDTHLIGQEVIVENDVDAWTNYSTPVKDLIEWYPADLIIDGKSYPFLGVRVKRIKVSIAPTAIIFLFLMITSCVPFKRLSEPVRMNYAFNFYDENSCQETEVLCNTYEVKNDTLYLYKAGYYTRRLYQRAVSNMIFPPDWKWYIVEPDIR